jgi:hypothetical protein
MKIEKIRNQLGPETIKELEALSKPELLPRSGTLTLPTKRLRKTSRPSPKA